MLKFLTFHIKKKSFNFIFNLLFSHRFPTQRRKISRSSEDRAYSSSSSSVSSASSARSAATIECRPCISAVIQRFVFLYLKDAARGVRLSVYAYESFIETVHSTSSPRPLSLRFRDLSTQSFAQCSLIARSLPNSW